MENQPITHIKHIAIEGLWGDATKNLSWTLNPDVNILAGSNGSGKTTVMRAIIAVLTGNQHEGFIINSNKAIITLDNDEYNVRLPSLS